MNRLRPTLSNLVHLSQYCGLPGNTIFDVVEMIRDATVYMELIHAQLCILFLDFKASFDRILHTYLLWMLKSYGYSMKFIKLIQGMYDKAFSLVQINGYIAGLFPIQYSVTQGCSMSMLLFILVLNLLICLLKQHFTSIRTGH